MLTLMLVDGGFLDGEYAILLSVKCNDMLLYIAVVFGQVLL